MNDLCSKCKEFPRRATTKTGSYCRRCHAEYQTAYNKRNGYKYQKDIIARLRAIVIAGKDKPCADCGLCYHWYVMDYDHVRGEKLFNLAEVAGKRLREEQVYAEIAKCDVVCSNCHRMRSFGRLHAGIA